MKPKHIVIDARIRRSSTGRYVDRLLQHLQTVDTFHRYTILLQPDDTWQPQAKNFTTLPCPYPQFSFNPLHDLGFASLLRRLKPDLVHFTMTQQPLTYFGKIVTTTHDLTMFRFVRRGTTPVPVYWLKITLYRLLVRWSHTKSKKIIAPTIFVAKDIANFQPATNHKLVVTYESAEPPMKTPGQQPAQLAAKDHFILYVGTAFPHKNLPALIAAFELLHAKDSKLKLVFVGKTDVHYEELRQIAAASPASNNIVFTGFVSEKELKWLYEHCAAYVFTSLSEGFGLPPLEAMTYSAPVVSSNASCMPEVYGDAAQYFDATNVQDIAANVSEVLHSQALRERLIANGQAQLKKYSWKRMAEETLLVYKEVLGEITSGTE